MAFLLKMVHSTAQTTSKRSDPKHHLVRSKEKVALRRTGERNPTRLRSLQVPKLIGSVEVTWQRSQPSSHIQRRRLWTSKRLDSKIRRRWHRICQRTSMIRAQICHHWELISHQIRKTSTWPHKSTSNQSQTCQLKWWGATSICWSVTRLIRADWNQRLERKFKTSSRNKGVLLIATIWELCTITILVPVLYV